MVNEALFGQGNGKGRRKRTLRLGRITRERKKTRFFFFFCRRAGGGERWARCGARDQARFRNFFLKKITNY